MIQFTSHFKLIILIYPYILSTAESDDVRKSTELKIHTADVKTVTHETEEVANFGSMHVLGQQVTQRTLTVVNGIVQGMLFASNCSHVN